MKLNDCCYLVYKLCPTLCEPPGLYPARFLCPWSFPGKNTRVGCHFLLQGIFPDPGTEPVSLVSSVLASPSFTTLPHGKPHGGCVLSHVQLFFTPWTVACQIPLAMEFSRQEHWNGLPFPSSGDLPDSDQTRVSHIAGRFFTI